MRALNIVDKQISDNLVQLNLTQKKVVLSVIKAFTAKENDFEDEMNKRFAELENGTVTGYTWDEAVDHARLSYKSSKKKK
jgi:hypothetical protein